MPKVQDLADSTAAWLKRNHRGLTFEEVANALKRLGYNLDEDGVARVLDRLQRSRKS